MKKIIYLALCFVLCSCFSEQSIEKRMKIHKTDLKEVDPTNKIQLNGVYLERRQYSAFDIRYRFYKFYPDGRAFISDDHPLKRIQDRPSIDSIISLANSKEAWHVYYVKEDLITKDYKLYLEYYGGGYSGYYYQVASVTPSGLSFGVSVGEKVHMAAPYPNFNVNFNAFKSTDNGSK